MFKNKEYYVSCSDITQTGTVIIAVIPKGVRFWSLGDIWSSSICTGFWHPHKPGKFTGKIDPIQEDPAHEKGCYISKNCLKKKQNSTLQSPFKLKPSPGGSQLKKDINSPFQPSCYQNLEIL